MSLLMVWHTGWWGIIYVVKLVKCISIYCPSGIPWLTINNKNLMSTLLLSDIIFHRTINAYLPHEHRVLLIRYLSLEWRKFINVPEDLNPGFIKYLRNTFPIICETLLMLSSFALRWSSCKEIFWWTGTKIVC